MLEQAYYLDAAVGSILSSNNPLDFHYQVLSISNFLEIFIDWLKH